MSKVYGYCRTAREGDMEEQIELISNYCKKKGLNLAICYCDDGVSAHGVPKEELDKLLEVLERGSTIVTKDISRFARNPIVQQLFVNEMDDRGVEIICVDYAEDEDNKSSIEAWFNQRWAKQMRDE